MHTGNGGVCQIYRQGRGFVFVNENGTPARFDFTGPRRLGLTSGDWNPYIVATVGQDEYGRTLIRFKEPGQPAGYWVRYD